MVVLPAQAPAWPPRRRYSLRDHRWPDPGYRPASAAAIDARVREVVFVTRASGSTALRSRCSAATALASGYHATVSTPSMSISTVSMRRIPRHVRGRKVWVVVRRTCRWRPGWGSGSMNALE
jgi:hypothetical protein